VRLDVLGQVIAAHKLLVALAALEPLLARVRPSVALQLIGAREAFAAKHPGADKWPLAGVPAEVSPQMGGLAVNLLAAGDVADVLALLVRVLLAIGAVGASAGHSL